MKRYYQTPHKALFDEVKRESIKIWKTYDDTYGYASQKIQQVESIENISDNIMSIIAMFDSKNIQKLAQALSKETKEDIVKRLLSVNNAYIARYFYV